MSRYARIENGLVAEIAELPGGLTPQEAYHPDVAKAFVPCGEDVAPNMVWDGSKFASGPAVDEKQDAAGPAASSKRRGR